MMLTLFLHLQPPNQPEAATSSQSQPDAAAPITSSVTSAPSLFLPEPESSSPFGQKTPPSFTSTFTSSLNNSQSASQAQGGQPSFGGGFGGFGAPSAGVRSPFGAPDSPKEPEPNQPQPKPLFGVPANNFTFTTTKPEEAKPPAASQPTTGFFQGKHSIG